MREYPGLLPWHLDEMWPAEIDELVAAMNKRIKAENAAARKRR